jgi:uncharacterized membrane protein YgdD (TMEM256/DUF423 family)
MLGVVAGAFGAHGLEGLVKDGKLTERQFDVFEIAVRYQMYHAFALAIVGLLAAKIGGSKLLSAAGWAFLLGTLIFSGSLYAFSLSDVGIFGAIAPIGGTALIVGWALLAAAAKPSKPPAL